MATKEPLASSSKARVDHITARLSAAGFTPRVTAHEDHTCIETEVPDSISAEFWREFLALLESADWFGFIDSSERGRTAWAAVSKEAPATAVTVRGRGYQL